MNKRQLWKNQGKYKSFKNGKPMILANENGATILKLVTPKKAKKITNK
jgi:hypothetical protein